MHRVERLDLPTIAARLRELEARLARLTVHHGDPERFFVERSELKAGIGAVARQLEGRRDPRPDAKPARSAS
ncbi:MAG: hypothetical protein JO000_16155 [Alphaproteobacteria bacterium]|nr:hypothetical protein [Alphaproteobacteria bacterium]